MRRITVSAMQGAFALGMDEQDIVEAVCALSSKDLHKSMAAVLELFINMKLEKSYRVNLLTLF